MRFSYKYLNLFALTLVLLFGIPATGGNQRLFSGVSVSAQTIEERKQEGDRLFELGVEQLERGDVDAWSESWGEAIEIYQEIGDKAGQLKIFRTLGSIYMMQSNYTYAQKMFHVCLVLAGEMGDKVDQNYFLGTLGNIYLFQGDYPNAKLFFQLSFLLTREIGDQALESIALDNLGNIYLITGEYTQAEEFFRLSLEIAREMGNKEGEGLTLNNIGNIYLKTGEYTQAEQYYRQSLLIVQEIGNKTGEGNALGSLGNIYLKLEEYIKAEQYYRQSLIIFREIGYKVGEGNALRSLGNIYHRLKEYAKAEEYLQQSLRIFQEIGNKPEEGSTLIALGQISWRWGEYAQAEQYYQQSLMISQEIGDKAVEASSLLGLGQTSWRVGEYTQAEQHLQQSLISALEIGDKAGESSARLLLGNIYMNQGESAQAEQHLQQSLIIARETGDKAEEGIALNNLGNIYLALQDYPKAEQIFQQSLLIARETGNKEGEVLALGNLGVVYMSLGEEPKAEEHYQQSLLMAREIGDNSGESLALKNLGIFYNKLGEYVKAEQHLMAAIEVYEKLRPHLTDQQRISLFEQQKVTYDFLKRLLISQNKHDNALEISERGRARAFVELLAERLSDTRETPVAVPPPNLQEIRQIAADQKATIVQYSIVSTNMGAGLFQVSFESELYIWVIQPTGEITFRHTDLKPLWQEQNTWLAKLIADARCFDNNVCRRNITVVSNREGTPEVRSARFAFNQQAAQEYTSPISDRENQELKQLHELLIEPIADLLPTTPNEKVIFVPQNSLFLVPFPALQDAKGQYLIEKHTIFMAPSIQVLALTREQKQTRSGMNTDILIVGNPTMPIVEQQQLSSLEYAEQEAREIGQLFNVSPLIGSQATKASVVQKMLSSRIIHLATHGSFDPNVPLDSWLALTPSGTDNGLLTAAEIFELNLNADLVVLSACDTGRGKITGDGVVGLSRAFISAGVPSVLVSLWKVPDDSTSLLMQKFYQSWEESGDKAQALRQAMLMTMQEYPNPVYWAAFTLMGEAE